MKAAEAGGMAAVCETEHLRDRIAANPSNRARIMGMDVKRFIANFARWREPFATGAALPMIGATEQDLRSIRVPTLVVPGHDRTHGRATGERVGALIPGAELHILLPGGQGRRSRASRTGTKKRRELATLHRSTSCAAPSRSARPEPVHSALPSASGVSAAAPYSRSTAAGSCARSSGLRASGGLCCASR